MKVLSIDFDIIMGPSIELYNARVPNPYNWDMLIEDYPFFTALPANMQHYADLVKILMEKVKPDTPFTVSNSHLKLYDVLKDDTNLEIVNIDHHHDLGYEDIDGPRTRLTCANWVEYIFDEDRIDRYVWLNNPTSRWETKRFQRYPVEHYLFKDKVDEVLQEDFDKVFLCLSDEWVPPQYYPLFNNLIYLLEKTTQKEIEIDHTENL